MCENKQMLCVDRRVVILMKWWTTLFVDRVYGASAMNMFTGVYMCLYTYSLCMYIKHITSMK